MNKMGIKAGIESLREAREIEGEYTYCVPGIFFDGEGCVVYVYTKGREIRFESNDAFEAEFDYVDREYEKYEPFVRAACERFGTVWDRDRLKLTMTFRRNDMSMTRAMMNFIECMQFLVGLDMLYFY